MSFQIFSIPHQMLLIQFPETKINNYYLSTENFIDSINSSIDQMHSYRLSKYFSHLIIPIRSITSRKFLKSSPSSLRLIPVALPPTTIWQWLFKIHPFRDSRIIIDISFIPALYSEHRPKIAVCWLLHLSWCNINNTRPLLNTTIDYRRSPAAAIRCFEFLLCSQPSPCLNHIVIVSYCCVCSFHDDSITPTQISCRWQA